MKNRFLTVMVSLCLTLILCLGLVSTGSALENMSPIAENLELCTYRGVSVGGRLSAVDPEGDLLSFEISTDPGKGVISLTPNGDFVYTPISGKKGRDYFGYKAMDSQGNYSQEATVIIRIEKQKTKITYSDMVGSGSHYSAVALAERGVFVGPSVGGDYIFEANQTVTRGEFLAMCLKLTGTDVLSGVTRTGFADDDSIPMWIKPYVSTALIEGVISGYSGDFSGPVFDSQAPVSYYESAVMLNNVLNLTDVTKVSAIPGGSSIPVWAVQATSNLQSCRLLPAVSSMSNFLTRADAAKMLIGAAEVLEKR